MDIILNVPLNAREVCDCAKMFQREHRSFFGPGNEEKWYGTCVYKPDGKWDQQANQMIELFAQSGHQRNLEAKSRKKHHSLHSGPRKHRVNDAHHSLSKSAQCLQSSVELVKRLV